MLDKRRQFVLQADALVVHLRKALAWRRDHLPKLMPFRPGGNNAKELVIDESAVHRLSAAARLELKGTRHVAQDAHQLLVHIIAPKEQQMRAQHVLLSLFLCQRLL